MGIDIKIINILFGQFFGIWSHSAQATGFLILALGKPKDSKFCGNAGHFEPLW